MYENDENDEILTEKELQDNLQALLMGERIDCTLLEGTSARSFEDSGVMTYNKGLVVRTLDGSEFQLTIVKSR